MKNLFPTLVLVSIFLPAFAGAVTLSCVDIQNNLARRDTDLQTNNEVTTLQGFLKDSGYFAEEPIGNFGPKTEKAVKKFQTANKIYNSGFVGPITRAKIRKVSGCAAPVVNGTAGTCTGEVKLCANGSYAARIGANCTWAVCPSSSEQTSGGSGGSTAGNGICGPSAGSSFTSAPTTGLCNSGTASTVTGTGPFTWSCTATDGMSSATCSASLGSGTVTNPPPAGNVTCNTSAGEVFGGNDVDIDEYARSLNTTATNITGLGYSSVYYTPRYNAVPASGTLGVSFKFKPDTVNYPSGFYFFTADYTGNVEKDFVLSDCPHSFDGAVASQNPFGAVAGTKQQQSCRFLGGLDGQQLNVLWATTPLQTNAFGLLTQNPSFNCILDPKRDYFINVRPKDGVGNTRVQIVGRNR